MFRRSRALLILLLVVPSVAFGQDRTTIFEGMDMRLVSIVDAMTDDKSCALFVDNGPIYVAVYGHDGFTIWADDDADVNFATDATHLIRVGEQQADELIALSKRNGLKLASSLEAKSVVDALLAGERVRLRYYDWPGYDEIDQELKAPNRAYVYNMAVEKCGWKDLGLSGELSAVELKIYQPDDPDSKGYATVEVVGKFWATMRLTRS